MGIVSKVKETFSFSKEEYKYECDNCGERFESTLAAPALVNCPACGAENPAKLTSGE